jgi:hypothetical protein
MTSKHAFFIFRLSLATLVVVLVTIWIIDNFQSIRTGLSMMSIWQLVTSYFLVIVGLILLKQVWGRVLSGYGWPLSGKQASKVFYTGQIGKYIPGSVWAIAYQAALARKYMIPVRTTTASGLILIYLLFVSSFALLGFFSVFGQYPVIINWDGLPFIFFLVAAIGVNPRVLSFSAKSLAKSRFAFDKPWRASIIIMSKLLLVWLCFGSAIATLSPVAGLPPTLNLLGDSIFYFSLAFISGLALPIAPSGIGVREAVLVIGMTPGMGLEAALLTAILARLIHTLADLSLAAYSAVFD